MQHDHLKNPHAGPGGSYDVSVISISTSRFEKCAPVHKPEDADDVSGRIIIDLLQDAGHNVRSYHLISDEINAIRQHINDLVNHVDIIVTTGGTGLAPRDVTIEAVEHLVEKKIPGFGELFRLISYEQVGSAAMLTRALGGIAENTVLFCLPGSPRAVKLAMEKLIVPELNHIKTHVSGER